MLAKMRLECGVDYTSKLDGMFTDIDLAKSVLQTYKQSLSSTTGTLSNELEADIMVLTTSYWPTYPILEMKIPPEITRQMVFIFIFLKFLNNFLEFIFLLL